MFGKKSAFQTVIMSMVLVLLVLPTTPLLSQDQEEKSDVQKKTEELFKMSLEELMNVKVTTADKTEEKIADIPASVVLITRQDIEMYGYQSLEEVLDNIPGLYGIVDYARGGTNYGVRGFWSGLSNQNMIILVNGVQQLFDIGSTYPLDNMSVPVEAIERIEVIRGPMSVIYGNGAFYGAINIITQKAVEDESKNIFSISIGTEKTKKFLVKAEGETDDFYYVFNASLYNTYGIDKPLSNMMSDPSILPLNYGVPEDSRTGGRLENNEKYFNLSGTFKGFFLNLSYNETKSDFYFNLPSVANGSSVKNSTVHMAFGYRKEFSDVLTLEGKFTYSEINDWLRFDHLFEDFYGLERLESSAVEVALDAFITPSDEIKITTGLYYRAVLEASDLADLPSFHNPYIENINTRLIDGDNIVTQAIYAQVNYNPIDSLRLVAGIRLEQTPKYGIYKEFGAATNAFTKTKGFYNWDKVEIIPRFAAIYYLNDDNIFKFLFGKAINRPSFFQNSFNSLDSDPNNELKPESIQTLELNYINSISSYFNLNISIFRNTLENLITRVVEFDSETNEYSSWSDNAGKMITNGIEMTLKAEPVEHFRFELSGVYQKTKDKRPDYETADVNVAYSPKFLGYLKASYRSEYFTLAVTGNYVGAMETFWDETNGNPDGTPKGARIGEKVDGYFVLGANLRIEDVLLDGLFLNIRCSNLLDEQIRYPTFTNNPWADKGTIGLGRSFLVSLGYKF